MKPLKAQKYEESRITYPFWAQRKLNGVRALWQNGAFYSRDFERWNDPVVAHINKELRSTFDSRIVLDGEMYVHGWLLQNINGAIGVNRLQPNEKTPLVAFHIFDVVNFRLPFFERTKPVFDTLLCAGLSRVIPVRPTIIYDQAQADAYYIECVSEGYEGMMYRLGDCPYTKESDSRRSDANPRAQMSDKDNRVWHMLKRKDWHDDEFEIVRCLEGKETDKGGKMVGMLGAFECVNSQGIVFKVGSLDGFDFQERTRIWNLWLTTGYPKGHKLTVKYLTLTAEGIPFNATAQAIRD